MANLSLKTFTQLVQDQAAAIQSKCAQLVDFSVGSVLRATVEANAAIGLWLQADFLQVLATTRLATSTSGDVDTFVNDFGLHRLTASPATGTVNFARFTASSTAPFIPVGSVVQTADGSQKFAVVADATNNFYSSSLAGYTMPANVAGITVPVASLTSGAASNVVAGTINQISSTLVGIDTVVNVSAFTGGADAESDAALRSRFLLFINSLSKSTAAAVRYTVASLRLGVQCTVTENFNYDGSAQNGFFYVVVDDGSGAPSTGLINEVGAAIELVRPLAVRFAVFAPTILNADVAMTVTSAAGFDHNAVIGNVGDAVTAYINALPLGTSLSYTKLMQVAFNADPGVVDVTNYRLNGAAADIVATSKNVVKARSVTVV